MGGGTGSGAAPVIARAAREQGILTVGVVTKPFHFEGHHRMRLAESGIEELTKYVDTLIVIPNQNLFRVANQKTTFAEAFKMADDVLYCGVRGVTDLMVMPGLINLDFADIRAVMSEMGKAHMGTGEASGERRAIDAAERAIANPLLEDVSMKGARGVLINITGGNDLTLFEVDEAANRIRDEVDPEANIIFGSTFDPTLEGSIRISVVATGIDLLVRANKPSLEETIAHREKRQQELLVNRETIKPQPFQAVAQAAPPVQPAAVHTLRTLAMTMEKAKEVLSEVETAPETNVEEAEIPYQATGTTDARGFEAMPSAAPASQGEAARLGSTLAAAAARAESAARAENTAPAFRSEARVEPPRKPSLNIFQKMTSGLSRQATPPAAPQPVAPRTVAPVQPSRGTQAQPKLGGVDPSERPASGNRDEDMLDIPTFLRRQAN
jgi:cell division protein FtsZ